MHHTRYLAFIALTRLGISRVSNPWYHIEQCLKFYLEQAQEQYEWPAMLYQFPDCLGPSGPVVSHDGSNLQEMCNIIQYKKKKGSEQLWSTGFSMKYWVRMMAVPVSINNSG